METTISPKFLYTKNIPRKMPKKHLFYLYVPH
ncbi:hypothetical protein N186_07265 [Thermofilum adornatum]|uniref:Uncharacterized protein n=1 Tax=Thermofilum adornatum TaxID=1365176 RepID=S5ZMH9_9CREN|nr:hypothetical protein N186_07265 [Thermofilum adornatum]